MIQVTILIAYWLVLSLTCGQGQNELDLAGSYRKNAITLGFVFDITGSMWDDLKQVITGAEKILETILQRKDEELVINYIVVPFHDPDIGPVTVTSDPEQFLGQLKKLHVHGGGDCPEMSIGAIKLALDHSNSNSFLYVFTDARAKDYYLTEEVLRLVQAKETQVVFVMTGDCGDQKHPGFRAYNKIASTSSGQVFHLKKSDVNEVLEFVRASFQAHKVNLLAVDRARGPGPDIVFNVDSGLSEFTVSSAGDNPRVVLIDPKGNEARNGLSVLLSLKNVQIVNLKEPLPGPWTLRVESAGPHSVRSKGLSELDFVHGFSIQPVDAMGETKAHPITGENTYVLVKAVAATSRARFDKIEFLEISGKTITESLLRHLPRNPGTYRSDPLSTPKDYFYIKLTGLDEEGHPFQRITATAIGSKLPDIPEVSTPSLVTTSQDKTVDLNCTIYSGVPFSAQWFREDAPVSRLERFQSSSVLPLSLGRVDSKFRGMWTCKASNNGGSSFSTVYLDVKDEEPPVIIEANNVTVIPGEDATLTCSIRPTKYPLNVIWNRMGHQNRATDTKRFSQLTNNDYVILRVTEDDVGWYSCTVQSSGGRAAARLFLNIANTAKVEIIPPSLTYVYGERILLRCLTSGSPSLTVQWVASDRFRKPLQDGRMRIDSDNLFIENASPEDEGLYECQAVGIGGLSLTASASLKYSEIPEIVVPSRSLKVNPGDSASLRCVGEGIPDPIIRWFKGQREFTDVGDRFQVLNEGYLRILDSREEDTGNYRCVATNVVGSTEETLFLQVGEPPSIPSIENSNTVDTVKVNQGGKITLKCLVRGHPKPEVTWTMNGQTLPGKTGPDLELDFVTVNNGGRYSCHAKNHAGVREKDFQVSVLVPPKFLDTQVVPFAVKVITLGETVEFHCDVRGIPIPVINWFKNGEIVLDNVDSNVKMSSDKRKLTIDNVIERHAGNYTCVAENEAGKIKKVTSLKVLVAPSMKRKGAKRVVVKEGETMSLECLANGIPTPDIHWLRNGQFLPRTDYGKLIISNVKAYQKGKYICMATNVAGRDQREFIVEVLVPPKRKDLNTPSNKDVRVLLNEPLSLTCDIEGYPPPVISWFKDDFLLEFYPKTVYHLSDDGRQLSVPSSGHDIEGNYSCYAQNNAGDDRINFNVLVIVPPHIDENVAKKVVTQAEGKDVELECPIIARPLPGVTWLKDGLLFRETSSGGKLKLTVLSKDMGGKYICIVGNEGGNMEHEIELKIAVPPKVKEDESTPSRITSVLHRPVTLVCHVISQPPPTIVWSKDGVALDHALDPNLSFSSDARQLKLKHARLLDEGVYTCAGTNMVGTTTKDVLLEVNVPPSIGETETQIFINLDNSVELVCPVSGQPNPSIVWMKNGHLIKDQDDSPLGFRFLQSRQTLLISRVLIDHAGIYTCLASNVAGKSEKHYTLSVLVQPSIAEPTYENISVQVGHPLVLKCEATGTPLPRVTWYKDGVILGEDEEYGFLLSEDRGKQLQVLNAEKQDGGEYVCEAENAAGSDSKTFMVHVTIPPLILKNNTTESLVTVNSRVLLECISQGEPQPNLTWMKDGEVLDDEDLGDQAIDLLRRKQVLEIKQAFVNHNGVYTCLAENDAGIDQQDFLLKVFGQPRFTSKSPANLTVTAGERTILNCLVDAEPSATVTWKKNGKRLDTDLDPLLYLSNGGQTLNILHTRSEDSAQYECLAVNSVGMERWNISLQVNSPPLLEGQTGNNGVEAKYAIAGSNVELECYFVGNPWPVITWRKNDIEVTAQDGVEIIADEQVVKINNVKLEDAGNYTCSAFSSAGYANKTIKLIVQVPPSILVAVSDVSVVLGGPIQLECYLSNSSGISKVTRIWSKNGQPLTSFDDPNIVLGEDGLLRILKARLHDSGIYNCMAVNEAGSDRVNRNLRVVVPATIERANYNPNPTAIYNQALTLSCEVDGSLPITIKWYKEGIPLDEYQYTVYHGGQKLDLYLTDATEEGNYSCVVENEAGEDFLEYNVKLLDRPQMEPLTRERTFQTEILEGQSVTLNCPMMDDSPQSVITWYKDNVLLSRLKLPPNVVVSTDGLTLRIVRAQASDAGSYQCVATNMAGEARSDILLNILVAPWFSENDSLISIGRNQTAILRCHANGNPEPFVSWIKDGQELNDSYNIEIGDTVLRLRNVDIEDEGIYSCMASNQAGIMFKNITVTVLFAPSVIGPPANVTVSQGSIAALDCPVDGQPTPKVLWYKDGKYIAVSENRESLLLNDVTSLNAGTYSCVGVNEGGEANNKVHLTVLVPATVHEVIVSNGWPPVLGSSVRIFCNASGITIPDYTWTKNGIPLLEDSTHVVTNGGKYLLINNLNESDEAHYRCTSSNELGSDDLEVFLDVLSSPSINNTKFRVESVEGEPLTLECPVIGDPQPTISWLKNEEPVINSDRINVTSGLLSFNALQMSDEGIYVCKAENQAGVTRKNISVEILVPPAIANGSSPANLTSVEGPLTLRCVFDAKPVADVTWVREESVIGTGETLLLDADQFDEGTYTCLASNIAGNSTYHIFLSIIAPPRILGLNIINTIKAMQNDSVTLLCAVSGRPSPVLKWVKNGKPFFPVREDSVEISENGDGIIFNSLQASQAGNYTCLVENQVGKANASFLLDVFVPPTLQSTTRTVKGLLGHKVTLNCFAKGHPDPTVEWAKIVAVNSTRVLGKGTTYIIDSASVNDEGIFICVARNDAGSAISEMELVVEVPPSIAIEEATFTVLTGYSILLPCQADGKPQPIIHWKIDNGVLSDTAHLVFPNGSLLVQQAVPDDSGTYLCVAINDAGVHKARRYLQVQAPPKISYISDTVTYGNKGEDLSLSCKATGTPVPMISWQRTDGRELKFKNGGRFRSPKSGLLEIVLLEPDDMATYQCVAQNEVGVDVGYVQLVVHSPPAIEAERVKEKVILKGGQVALPCRAQGYPTPLISWTHNGILLEFPRHDLRLEASGDLTILSAELIHNGTYVCSAANAAGKQYQEVTLRVQIPPTISTLPRDTNISVGTEFLLTCEAIGIPVPKLSWLHNDQKLTIAGAREGKTELLVVKANKEDEGVYSCIASNDAGEKKATATVQVKSPPIITSGTTVVKYHEGDTAILECPVVADPPPVIVWKKDENSVSDNTRMIVLLDGSLQIANVKAEDAGQYICVAVNGYGRAEGLTMLDVSSQPRFKVEPQDQLIHEGSFASLDCLAIGSPKPVISWSKNGLPLKPELNSVISSNSSLQIFVVSTKDVGIYECEASNEFGTISKRASVRVIVNGGWSSWGLWSTCSVSCGGGLMTHVRQCNNPVPSPGGQTCSGSSVENQECNLDPCPVHGGWSAWGSWSACSVTCNNGVKKRTRLCNNPQPRNDGRRCLGLSQQALTCLNAPCDDTPKLARGHLVGEINGEDIGLVVLSSNVTQQGDRRFVSAILHNVSPTIGQSLETMLPLLSPVYWASASEEDDAKNGFKLTRGKFQRESDVTFATGENLRITYVGRGLDADKHLLVDVVITGRTPFLPSLGLGTTLLPYKETYVQTGPDTLHVESTRFHSIHGYSFPEAWKHTVHYDGSLGTMRNLVEELNVGDVESLYDSDSQSLRYSLSASISKGHPECPDGFRLSEGHCKDVNECQEEPSLCSHGCTNIVGSYYCLCNTGFTLGPSGHICQDIDECLRYPCTHNQVCENTVGSYECLIRCPIGYLRSDDGDNCIDIDECKNKSTCSHNCENIPGSYLCSCLPGYHLVGKSNCLDIDECRSRIAPCEQNCTNLPGSYSCGCLEGFRLLASGKCEDIDECSLNKDLCPPGQLCVNKRGSYICSCREGFAKDVNDTCEDVDECLIGSSKCHHSQICENRPGGYTCSCPRGFQSFALGKPCLDIDECVQNPPPCNFRCVNLVGDYECVCPPDQKRLANRKACIGMDQSERGFAELLASPGHGSCPPGMRAFSSEGDCQDIDECLNTWLCQHECVNTLGSYKCYCPPGYRLGSDGSSCQDINECLELGIKCSSDQTCFNTKGGYKCVETPCPPSYQRDSLTNFCRLKCEIAPIACPPNSKYADTLAFKMVALPSGIEAYEDLVRLLVYDHEGFRLNNAVFEILENQSNVPFEIRPEAGVGILYSKMALDNDREYKMKVRAVSYDPVTRVLKYTSQFVVYLSVSQFPY